MRGWEGDWLYSSSSSFSFGSRAGWSGPVSHAHTHGDVPMVHQAKCRSWEHGDVYPSVLSLSKSPCC